MHPIESCRPRPATIDRVSWPNRGKQAAVAAVGGAGLVLTVVGTFLPWLRSGEVLRDSYQLIGVISSLGFLDGTALEVALNAWFGVTPLCTLSVVAYAFGQPRVAATISLVTAIITGTVSGGATVQGAQAHAAVGIAGTGPAVTLAGSILTLAGAVGVYITARRRSAHVIAGGEP